MRGTPAERMKASLFGHSEKLSMISGRMGWQKSMAQSAMVLLACIGGNLAASPSDAGLSPLIPTWDNNGGVLYSGWLKADIDQPELNRIRPSSSTCFLLAVP